MHCTGKEDEVKVLLHLFLGLQFIHLVHLLLPLPLQVRKAKSRVPITYGRMSWLHTRPSPHMEEVNLGLRDDPHPPEITLRASR